MTSAARWPRLQEVVLSPHSAVARSLPPPSRRGWRRRTEAAGQGGFPGRGREARMAGLDGRCRARRRPSGAHLEGEGVDRAPPSFHGPGQAPGPARPRGWPLARPTATPEGWRERATPAPLERPHAAGSSV